MQEDLSVTVGAPTKEPFDIILPAYGKIHLVQRAMEALYAHTQTPFHLIVVNSPGPDHDLQEPYWRRMKKEHDNITYIFRQEGWKNGNQFFNAALRHAENDFVATVTSSSRVEPDWETVALQILRQDPKVGTVGLKSILTEGFIEGAGIAMQGFTPVDIGKGLPAHRLSHMYEPAAVQWACAIHRKRAIQGNLDETIWNGHVGWDDIDNCFVLRSKGWKIVYCGMGAYYHTPRASRGNDSPEAFEKNQENARLFYKRWGFWEQFVRETGYKEPEKAPEVKATGKVAVAV